jgi:GTP-binding protein
LKVEFVLSASAPDQFPADGLREIAFLGRSNVGKSSLINALTGQKGLAFTSSTPGRTQTINFYRVDEKMYFVDLPGYGYAKVPRGLKDDWKRLIERYLEEVNRLEYLVVVTKMDKLNQTEQRRILEQIATVHPSPLPFSAVTGRGVREIWQAIQKTHQFSPSLAK